MKSGARRPDPVNLALQSAPELHAHFEQRELQAGRTRIDGQHGRTRDPAHTLSFTI